MAVASIMLDKEKDKTLNTSAPDKLHGHIQFNPITIKLLTAAKSHDKLCTFYDTVILLLLH